MDAMPFSQRLLRILAGAARNTIEAAHDRASSAEEAPANRGTFLGTCLATCIICDERCVPKRFAERAGEAVTMKLVTAVIQPDRLEAVRSALTDAEIFRLTIMDCRGFARQTGNAVESPGRSPVQLDGKIQLQIAVNEEFVEPAVRAILQGARNSDGRRGRVKVFVAPLEECIRVRTGERGTNAI